MKIVEFRIPIPLKLSDYQRCSIHLLIEGSLREMEGGSGLEIFRNEKFKSNDKIGYYTEKRYHLAKNLPNWLQSILGTKLTILTEKSWNLYPKLFTKYNNEVFPTAEFSLQTDHLESLVVSENRLNLNQHDLNKRQIMFVDLTKFSKLKNYDPKYDITKAQIGDFLPLKQDWYKDTNYQGMMSYKLLRLNIPYFGMLSSKIENYIVNFLYESIIYYTCMGLCSYEKWKDLTIESLRATEVECYSKLNEAFKNNYSKTLDKTLKLTPVPVVKGTEIVLPKELSLTSNVDSMITPEKDSSFEAKVDEKGILSPQTMVMNDKKPETVSRAVLPSQHVATDQALINQPVSSQYVNTQAVSNQDEKQLVDHQHNHLALDQMVQGPLSATEGVNELVLGKSGLNDQKLTLDTDRDNESVRTSMTCETFRIMPTESILPDLAYIDDVVVNVPKKDGSINEMELSGPVPVPVISSFDDSEFKDAVENLEDLQDSDEEKTLLNEVPPEIRVPATPKSSLDQQVKVSELQLVRKSSVDQSTQVDLSQLSLHTQETQVSRPELIAGPNNLQVGVEGTKLGFNQLGVASENSVSRPPMVENNVNQTSLSKLGLSESVPVQPFTTITSSATGTSYTTTATSNATDTTTSAATSRSTLDINNVSPQMIGTDSKLTSKTFVTSEDPPTTDNTSTASSNLQESHKVTSVSSSSALPQQNKQPQQDQKQKSKSADRVDKKSKGVNKEKLENKDNLSYDIPITFTGYLYKLGKGFMSWSWNLRYIIVCGFNLYYFDKKNDVRPKDTINLKNSRISWAGPHMSRPFVFSITTESKEVYFWSADEEESVKRWILLLQVLCEESPPNIVKQLAYELTYHQNNSDRRTIISKF